MKWLQLLAKIGAKSKLLKRVGTKLAVHLLPEEVETRVSSSRFVFRPKIDGLWYLNYSDAEPGVDRVLRENLKEGDTFIDIGAYIGYYSILAREIVGESGKVIAFEPNPENYKILKKNFELNRYKNCIPEKIALSDDEGYLKLYIGKYTAANSSFVFDDEHVRRNYYVVKTLTFDKYCEYYEIVPDLIKIDTEGAEYKILKGMQKVIDTYHPKLLIEVHPRQLEKQGVTLYTFFDFLKDKNYELYLITKDGRLKKSSIEKLVNLCKTRREDSPVINQFIFCGRGEY